MSENLRTYTKAVYGFEHVLRLTSERTLARKAPCAGWTGKDVVEHVFGAVKMIQSFTTTGKAPKSMPKVGADPLAQWGKLRDATLEALDHEGALHRIANDPFGPDFGPMPIDALIGFMAADIVPHTWDLARTAKVDERLDPTLGEVRLGDVEGAAGGRAADARDDGRRGQARQGRRRADEAAQLPRPHRLTHRRSTPTGERAT